LDDSILFYSTLFEIIQQQIHVIREGAYQCSNSKYGIHEACKWGVNGYGDRGLQKWLFVLGHFFLRVDDNEESNQEKLTVVMNIEEPFKW